MSNKKEQAAITAATATEMEKTALVPRLRFPEFQNIGEWKVKSLKNICQLNPSHSGIPEKFAYIDLESVEAGKLKSRKIIYQENAPSRAQRLLCYGDVIFQIVRPYQRNNLHFKITEEMPYVASTGYAQLRANESDDFLFQAVHTDGFVEQVIAKCTGSSYPAINSSDFADLLLPIPKKAEQQKIADCLGSIDELIALESQKLDALKRHKKGLMQQLFPAEGETVPRLRFAELDESWRLCNIGNFFDLTDKAEKTTIFDKEKVLTVKLHAAGVVKSERTTLTGGANYFNRKYGQFIFSKIDLLNGAFGIVPYTLDGFASSSDVPAYSFNTEHSPSFFIKWLNAKYKYLDIERTGTSSTLKRVSPEKFLSLEILVPNLHEQQKIADCLTSLDELIHAQTQKIDALRTHKKGLMQQLFPAVEDAA